MTDPDTTFALDVVRLARACGMDPILARFYPDRRAWVLEELGFAVDARTWRWPDLVPPNPWTAEGREALRSPGFREMARRALDRALEETATPRPG